MATESTPRDHMKKSIIVGFAVLALPCILQVAKAASDASVLVGKTFVSHFSKSNPQYIDGCTLEDDAQPVFTNQQASHLVVSGARCGSVRVYVLSVASSTKCSKGQDCPVEIVDTLTIGDLKRSERLSHIFNDHFCFPPKNAPSMDVAIARFRAGANRQKRWNFRSGLVAAWGVDVKEKKFVAMDLRRIECETIAYD